VLVAIIRFASWQPTIAMKETTMSTQDTLIFSRARFEQIFAGLLFGGAVALVLGGALAMVLGTAISG
jgi:hypothetical protein